MHYKSIIIIFREAKNVAVYSKRDIKYRYLSLDTVVEAVKISTKNVYML